MYSAAPLFQCQHTALKRTVSTSACSLITNRSMSSSHNFAVMFETSLLFLFFMNKHIQDLYNVFIQINNIPPDTNRNSSNMPISPRKQRDELLLNFLQL